jgi:virulence-associated protein VagC
LTTLAYHKLIFYVTSILTFADPGDQVECSLEGGAIVIRPLRRTDDEFSVEILKDLVSKGFSGDELVREFEAERYRVKKAVDRLREEADRIADGVQPASRFDDIFDSDD